MTSTSIDTIACDDLARLSENLRAGYLEYYGILPLKLTPDHIVVGHWCDEPEAAAIEDVEREFNKPAELVRISREQGLPAAQRLYGTLTNAKDLVSQLAAKQIAGKTEATIDDLVALANEAPVIQLVNLLIVEALESRASDVHLETRAHGMQVRYRIDGVMQAAASPPTGMQAPIVSRLKIMAELDIAERRVPQDGRIRLRMQDREVDVRVSTLPSLHGEDVVLRLLDQSRNRLLLRDLGMPSEIQDGFAKLISKPHGLVLVTGPTGSGKTTTLYAAVEELNDGETKIVTVEDPVEYAVEGVTQVHVNSRVGLTFASALRAFLRQDPDVMLVGEIRDSETAEISTHAALTGHLVLSTLHTNDAISAITRLLDLQVQNYLVASTLEGIVAQRLVRKLCSCMRPRTLRAEEAAALAGLMSEGEEVFGPHGCPSCRQSGYRGRTGVYEMIVMNDDLRRALSAGASSFDLRSQAHADSAQTLLSDAVRLVRCRITSPEEALRITTK